ncbi:hypothetical protein H4S01_000560 [Coemansia sp. RSA 2610]|nr:hypothetical protein H4S01_000560 [Coemansia sp. RSA 2610]
MKCEDISARQQKLLFQCYCKTVYNTNFVNLYPTDNRVVCTRNDHDNYDGNMTDICENYQKYDGCNGVNISAAPPAVTLAKVAMLAMFLFGDQVPTDELPPYSPYDELEEPAVYISEDIGAGNTTSEVPLQPTELAVTAKAGFVTSRQLLSPTGSLKVTLEDVSAASITVCMDNAFGNLLGIETKFCPVGSDHNLGLSAIKCASTTDEKTDQTLMAFGLQQTDLVGQVSAECTIAIPSMADIKELVLRLPHNTSLEVVNIEMPMVRRLDIAVLGGNVQLIYVAADHIRVAIAAGLIDAQYVTAQDWKVSRLLEVMVDSAIIHGTLDLGSNDVRIVAKSRNWPLNLSVSESYQGSFSIRNRNGITNFGFSNAAIHEKTPSWLHGVIGTGPCQLQVENENAPVVITPH